MSANNSIAATVTQGDPDGIEDLSDSLEQLICNASKTIAKYIEDTVESSAARTVQTKTGTKHIPIPDVSLFASAPDGKQMLVDAVREILMEDLYLRIMMPTRNGTQVSS